MACCRILAFPKELGGILNSSRSRATWFVLTFLSFWLLTVPAAHAYVDPGTGSYIFQVLIGVFLGAAVAVKLFWRRIWGFVTRKPVRTTSEPAIHDKED